MNDQCRRDRVGEEISGWDIDLRLDIDIGVLLMLTGESADISKGSRSLTGRILWCVVWKRCLAGIVVAVVNRRWNEEIKGIKTRKIIKIQ